MNKKLQYYYKNREKICARYRELYRLKHPNIRHTPLEDKDKEVISYYLQDRSHSQLVTAKKFGVTQTAISHILKKNKISARPHIRTGSNNPKWRGGICIDRDGRKLIYSPNHPKPDVDKLYCYEYRLIMEKHLGRYLEKGEIVHHINNDVTDDRIENLAVMSQIDHINLHRKQGDMKRSWEV